MGAIREGKWKCGCGGVNRGSVQQCPSCGMTRAVDTKFFFDESDAPEVTDAAELERARAGADWVCSRCDNSNPAGAKLCGSCGAPWEGKLHKAGDVVPVPGADAASMPPPAVASAVAPAGTGTGAKLGIFGSLVFFGLLACCCFAALFFGRSKEAVAAVSRVEWKRTVDVEAVRPVQDTQWDSSPPGAYNVTHAREVRDHKKVQHGTKTVTKREKVKVGSHKVVTGHKDLGNGRFEDVEKSVDDYEDQDVPHEEPVYVEEPVYGERYRFTIDRWTPIRTPEASGFDVAPHWPDAQLQGKEREGTKNESYKVWFKVPEDTDAALFEPKTEAEFVKFAPGSSWKVKYNGTTVREIVGPAGAGAR